MGLVTRLKKNCYLSFIVSLLLIVCGGLANAQSSLSEPKAKAALLYNFIKHTQWPSEDELSQLNVLFIGDNADFYRSFSEIAAEATVRGKAISVERGRDVDSGELYQVVVIGKDKNNQLSDIASRLLRSSTLLITDDTSDPKVVMINFRYPDQQSLSFEINKSNIIYEKLTISDDVLLYGGTEIEVATLYKEMALSLQRIKSDVEATQQSLAMNRQQLAEKTSAVAQQKQKMKQVTAELVAKSTLLELQQQKLKSTRAVLESNEKSLAVKQYQLEQREGLVDTLEQQISENRQTLQRQQDEIVDQQDMIVAKSVKVESQQQTISQQRNLIIAFMALLIVVLVAVLLRQKHTLKRERRILEAEAALVKSQAASIQAYESNIKLKNDFLTAINHELRTPMNGILGAMQVADNDDLSSLQSAFEIVEQGAHEMMGLVDDVLTYTELQSGAIIERRENISSAQFLVECKQRALLACASKNIQLRWHSVVEIPPFIAIDSDKLNKVIDKLIGNAVKFTDIGCVDISFDVVEDLGEHQLCFKIKDTGSGIEQEQLEFVFEPFWQAERGFTRRYSGLGIGLTICKQILDAMGGSISIDSPDSKGCVVKFRCGYDVVAVPEADQLSQLSPEDTRTILVVEDNPVNQKVLQKMLEKLGYTSVVADDGEEALFLIERLRFAAILMDLQMPKIDGFTCTEEIRRRQDYYKQVPIIAVTANLMDSQQEKCIQAGMNAYLAKPVNLKRLQETLQAVLLAAPECD